jgi:hypothetical protein
VVRLIGWLDCRSVGRAVGRSVDLLHPFSRIRVINNHNPILHNQWEWVIYNRRKRVQNLTNFPLFSIVNIPNCCPIIYNQSLIINNRRIFCIINSHYLILIIYNSQNRRRIIYNQVIYYLQSRYVVIIDNHDLVLIIYNSAFITYNTSIIINNNVLQLVLFIKIV